jgi:LPS export ABC transporter protein LptC
MKTTAILLAFIALFLAACETEEKKQVIPYEGPLREMQEVEVLHTEKDKLKVKVEAKKVLEFQNGDQEFPEGIYLEFYDEAGTLTSTLRANHAYRFKQENRWRGRGKVEVKNLAKVQQLNTE